jgi:16S rRNA G966 N2-methylase RsmD
MLYDERRAFTSEPMSTQVTEKPEVLMSEQPWHPLSLCAPEITSLRVYTTNRGVLFNGDCLDILPHIEDESVHTVFADPPFNLAFGGSGTTYVCLN